MVMRNQIMASYMAFFEFIIKSQKLTAMVLAWENLLEVFVVLVLLLLFIYHFSSFTFSFRHYPSPFRGLSPGF